MNLSPRVISDLFSGRKRHNTLILHSALVSAIVATTVDALPKDEECLKKRGEIPLQPFPPQTQWTQAEATGYTHMQSENSRIACGKMDKCEFLGETVAKLIDEM